MLISTKGIVLKETLLPSDDRLITILTSEYGKISVFASSSKKKRSAFASATDLFCYTSFVLFKSSKDKYYINSADSETLFFGIRCDIEKVSLASYFAELCCDMTPENEEQPELMRLFLNCLHFLDKDLMSLTQLKAIFELRFACINGYMPDLVACCGCGVYECDTMYFSYKTGKIFCENCRPNQGEIPISKSILYAMRFICYSPFEKIFSFSLSDENINQLSYTTENYLIFISEKRPQTLDFYNELLASTKRINEKINKITEGK